MIDFELSWDMEYYFVDGATHRDHPQWLVASKGCDLLSWFHARCAVRDLANRNPRLLEELRQALRVQRPERPTPWAIAEAIMERLGPPDPDQLAPPGKFASFYVLKKKPLQAPRPRYTIRPSLRPAPLAATGATITITCVDDTQAQKPVPGVALELITAAGDVRGASSNAEGVVFVTGIAPGQVVVRVSELDGSMWKPLDGDASQPSSSAERTRWHLVRQGEGLNKVAHQYGLKSWKDLWDHPKNGDLRKQRKLPNLLQRGDHVYIPNLQVREIVRETDASHRIQISRKVRSPARWSL